MSEVALFLDAFHFIRPWVLALLLVVAVVWWKARDHGQAEPDKAEGIAPHLRDALQVGAQKSARLQPIDGVALALVFTILGAAGPTWSRVPDPFAAQTAPVVIALNVTEAMDAVDVQPSRLERAKQKIRDLLELRAGARTALVAYGGTAHRVLPLTEDAAIMLPYLEGLTSEVMPEQGRNATAALAIAEEILAGEDAPGGVLFVLDGLDPSDATALQPEGTTSLAYLSMLPDGQRDRGLDQVASGVVVAMTNDASDVRQLDRILNTAYRQMLLEDEDQQWDDRGRWFVWPALLLVLLWFRRGWTMRWGAVLVVLAMGVPRPAAADGVADWFFTPDQQGRIAYDRKDYGRAAELFTDPLWKGYALYRNGSYEKAAEVLAPVGTAEAEYIRGMSLIRNRSYRDGVRAFEKAVELDPDYPGAAENLAVSQEIVAYVERVQEQSDTGEEAGIGADEIREDNESNRGAETRIEAPTEDAPAILSTEQWMNTVETNTSDFLRLRFLLEANETQ